MLEPKSREQCLKALDTLIEAVKNNTIDGTVGTLLTTAAAIQKDDLLADKEKARGIVIIVQGENGGYTTLLEGAYDPAITYGSLVNCILEIWTRSQAEKFEAPIRSMVTTMLQDAAMLEKQITGQTGKEQ